MFRLALPIEPLVLINTSYEEKRYRRAVPFLPRLDCREPFLSVVTVAQTHLVERVGEACERAGARDMSDLAP